MFIVPQILSFVKITRTAPNRYSPYFLYQHDFSYYLFFRSCAAGVHRADPLELIAGFEVFGDTLGLGELGSNEVDLLIGLAVDIDQVLSKSVLHQHQSEGVRLMLLEILLPHPSEAADIPGRLGRKCQVGIVIVSVLGVSDVHAFILLFCF